MIRKAEKSDKKEAAILIYDAILDIAHNLTGEKSKEKAIEQLENYFCQDGNRLSYENCLVKEMNGKAVGIILMYHGRDAMKLDAPIKQYLFDKLGVEPVIDREADESDFYIDTLSVHQKYRNQKIGTALLRAAIQSGKEQGFRTISLVVEENNKKAHNLYVQLGFTFKKIITIGNHRYQYMYIQL